MKFDDKEFLSTIIKRERKKLNLTQSELAELVNLSDQHISRIESGCYIPSLKSFFQIVSVLKIDLKEFGFDIAFTRNQNKDELIQRISNATNSEIIMYKNVIDAVDKGFSEIKNI